MEPAWGKRPAEYYVGIVGQLRRLPTETEWVEFKANIVDPEEVGEYISALSNAAALVDKPSGYLVWGVENETHDIIGTTFEPGISKIGNEQLENWLIRLITAGVHFQFIELVVDEERLVVLEVERAHRHPTRFRSEEWIRVGSYKKRLKDHPDKERRLWKTFETTPFEAGIALDRVRSEDVSRFLDYPAYFELLKLPLPENREGILNALASDRLIQLSPAGGWDITNLGALLFAKKLEVIFTP